MKTYKCKFCDKQGWTTRSIARQCIMTHIKPNKKGSTKTNIQSAITEELLVREVIL